MSDAERFIEILWDRYAAAVPAAAAFQRLFGALRLDHVAFRSVGRPAGGIAAIAAAVEPLGWRPVEEYDYPDTHVRAVHLERAAGLPHLFVTEVRVERLSAAARRILGDLPPDPPPPRDAEALAAWFCAYRGAPSERDLLVLDSASQYAAWVLAFGRKPYHFAAAVDDVEEWSRRLREGGVALREGIEGERGDPLRLATTEVTRTPVALDGGASRAWPYAYLELAERRAGYDGFPGGRSPAK